MIQYHECGAQFWVEYRHAGPADGPVIRYDGLQVTVCPECGAPLPTDGMPPDPDDDSFLWVDADPDLVPPFTVPG